MITHLVLNSLSANIVVPRKVIEPVHRNKSELLVVSRNRRKESVDVFIICVGVFPRPALRGRRPAPVIFQEPVFSVLLAKSAHLIRDHVNLPRLLHERLFLRSVRVLLRLALLASLGLLLLFDPSTICVQHHHFPIGANNRLSILTQHWGQRARLLLHLVARLEVPPIQLDRYRPCLEVDWGVVMGLEFEHIPFLVTVPRRCELVIHERP